MRLLDINDGENIKLTEFFGSTIPPYAILSHTWGPADEEVSLRDILDNTGKNKAGFSKIEFCRRRATSDDLQYFWIDTCCIDKSSSAELTEAINSMFHWYQRAARCYVFLSDVSENDLDLEKADSHYKTALRQSRWFSRGWTLQELIAPVTVDFFSQEGARLGDKKTLEKEITEVTGIDSLALQGHPLHNFRIADRMSWAAKRTTTREEDNAYCLLGIFDVHMPLIYGEGKKAFNRLNEEINKSRNGWFIYFCSD